MADHSLPTRSRPLAYLSGSAWLRAEGAPVSRFPRPAEVPVGIGDPALRVVTDFSWESPITIASSQSIDAGLQRMISAGVRALLVTQDDAITGLITAYDIQGERPLQFLEASNYSRHDEIEVGHLMTPWRELVTLDWSIVEAARVHYLEQLLRETSATHVPLVERADQGDLVVRGVLSRARLERQLGRSISLGARRASH